jgi:hypothetical protein
MSSVFERQRQVRVPFSYVNGTMLELRTHKDASHSVHTRLWSQQDDPKLGPRRPIVGGESQPSIRSIVRLRSGAERSFVLTLVRLRPRTRKSRHADLLGLDRARAESGFRLRRVRCRRLRGERLHLEHDTCGNSYPAQAAPRRGNRAVRRLAGELPRRPAGVPAAFCRISPRGSARPRSRQTLGVSAMIPWVGHQQFAKERTVHPALSQLRSIPSRPSRRTALLRHAGIVLLRRRSLVAPLPFASSPFPPSPFQIWVTRAAGKDGAGFPNPSDERPGARAEAGAERSHAMRRCKGDPHWIAIKFKCNTCVRCSRPILLGEPACYYPQARSLMARARIAAKRRAGGSRRARSTKRTALRCKE